jgi:diguanylate cyclase (GGDEF)-like protein
MSESQTCYYHFLQSYNLGLQGKYIVAKKDLESGFKKCTSVANKVRYSALLANLYVISNDFELAINRLDYAIEHIDEVDDKELVQSVYSRAALVYRLVNHNELSIKFSELILNSDASDALKCSAKTNVLRILIKSNQNQVKEKDVRGAIAFCEEAEVYIYSNLLRLDWLDFMLNQNIKNYSIIKLVLNEVTTYQSQIDNTHYVNLISIKDSLFAKIYNKLGYEEEFLKFAKFTLDSSKALGNTKQKIEVLALLEKYYRMKGDFELAYDYLDKKNKAEALSFNQEQAKIMAFQTVKHNNLAKTQQIKFLNNQNQLLSLEKALTEKKSTNQKLVILFLFSLMGFMVLWGFRSRRVQNMYKHLSETDNMTGIYNRKGFRDFAESLLLQSKKEGRPVAMAIFDLDRFKRINDKYGHLKGDWAIKKTIAQCQLVQNDKITIGRIGGEEFAIVMRDSTSEELSEFVEECRIMIENIDSSATGHDFVITASFGVTSTNVSGYVYSKLLSDADHAMYDAKTSGRNMVINYKYNLI